jgi:hypothetical protein
VAVVLVISSPVDDWSTSDSSSSLHLLDDTEILDRVLVLGSPFGGSRLTTLLLVVVAGLRMLSERGSDDACI